ncbi:MAG: hypothetical protein V3S44_05650 [Alphaproteobacteria bacterium]
MSPLFHGPIRHWVMLVCVLGLLGWMGLAGFHTRHFNLFLTALIAIGAGVVFFTVATYRKGEAITREPIEEEDGD